MTLEAVIKLDRVHQPLQARSRKTLERVLDTFSSLLAEKRYDEITMTELARRSKIAVTSIYARFENKQALVLAAHERHRDEVMREIDAMLDPSRWQGADLETIVRKVMIETLANRKRRIHLLRAALLINDREVYQRAAELSRHASERMAALLAPHLTWLDPGERDRAVDFAMRAVTAVLQQRLVFGEIEPARFRPGEQELAERLANLFLGALQKPSGGLKRRKPPRPRAAISRK